MENKFSLPRQIVKLSWILAFNIGIQGWSENASSCLNPM